MASLALQYGPQEEIYAAQQDGWNSDQTEALEKPYWGNHSTQELRSSLGVSAAAL